MATTVSTTANSGTFAVTTSAQLLLASNSSRLRFRLQNQDAAVLIYWGPSNAVTTSNGMLIAANAVRSYNERYYSGAVYVIGSASAQLFWEEIV